MLTGFFTYRIVATAPRTPEPIEAGVVQLDKEGLTVYASVPVLTPPCQAKDSSGADVPLKAPTGSEQITVNSETWYVVARSVDPVPAGDYSISCTDDETGATYAAGPRMSVVAFVVSIFGAIGSFADLLRPRRRPPGRRRGQEPPPQPPRRHLPAAAGPGQACARQLPAWNTYPTRPGNTFPTQPPGTTFPPYNPGPNPDRPQDR